MERFVAISEAAVAQSQPVATRRDRELIKAQAFAVSTFLGGFLFQQPTVSLTWTARKDLSSTFIRCRRCRRRSREQKACVTIMAGPLRDHECSLRGLRRTHRRRGQDRKWARSRVWVSRRLAMRR